MSEKNTRDEGFSYTYSAKQREEIKRIRDKYTGKEENKMEQLRRLDAGAAKKGTAASLCVGIVSSLIFGTGMSMCLVFTDAMLFPGILTGLVGLLGCAAAYPLYTAITKRERARIAPEILRLSEELLK